MTNIALVDDEQSILTSVSLSLESEGFTVDTFLNGLDALEYVKNNQIDIILLDENMPGLNGFETLSIIKKTKPNLPIIMVTKNEEEKIIDDAIGSKVSDYLIKPVNPNQILHSLKKTLNQKNLVSEKASNQYQKDFRKINLDILSAGSFFEWVDIYKKIIYWKIELIESENNSMLNILENQLKEAIESQDAEKIMEANDSLTKLAVEREKVSVSLSEKEAKKKEEAEAPKQEEQPQPKISAKAQEWAEDNEWFGTDRVLTSAAMGIHEDLLGQGIETESDEYYNQINKRMKEYFPQKFATSTEEKTKAAPVQNVASVSRRSGGRKSVKLTKSQVVIAKKLGVPLEEYAKYVKEGA